MRGTPTSHAGERSSVPDQRDTRRESRSAPGCDCRARATGALSGCRQVDLRAAGVPAAGVNDVSQVVDDPQIRLPLGLLQHLSRPGHSRISGAGGAGAFVRWRTFASPLPPPALGADTQGGSHRTGLHIRRDCPVDEGQGCPGHLSGTDVCLGGVCPYAVTAIKSPFASKRVLILIRAVISRMYVRHSSNSARSTPQSASAYPADQSSTGTNAMSSIIFFLAADL